MSELLSGKLLSCLAAVSGPQARKRWLKGLMASSLMALVACSPMPGNYGLLPGFDQPLANDDPRIVEHPGTLWQTCKTCNALSWRHSVEGKLGALLTLGMVYGCSWHTWTMVDGRQTLVRADVYYPAGWEDTRKHERMHARGYADHPLARLYH